MSEIKADAETIEEIVQAFKDSGAGVDDVNVEWHSDDSTEFKIVGDLDGGEA